MKHTLLLSILFLFHSSLFAQQNSMMLTRKGFHYEQGGIKIKRKDAFTLLKNNPESAPFYKNGRIYANIGGVFSLTAAIINLLVISEISSSGTILSAKEMQEIEKKQNAALAVHAISIPFYLLSSGQIKKSVAAYNVSLTYFKPKKTYFDLQVGLTNVGLRMRF